MQSKNRAKKSSGCHPFSLNVFPEFGAQWWKKWMNETKKLNLFSPGTTLSRSVSSSPVLENLEAATG